MPLIIDLVPMPDGRMGVVLDVPPSDDGSVALWTAAERDAAIQSAVSAKCEELKDVLRFIASQEDLMFAECSVAEEIVRRAKAALDHK
jgi:hypothetical protein